MAHVGSKQVPDLLVAKDEAMSVEGEWGTDVEHGWCSGGHVPS